MKKRVCAIVGYLMAMIVIAGTVYAGEIILVPIGGDTDNIQLVGEDPEQQLQTFLHFACREGGEAKLKARKKSVSKVLEERGNRGAANLKKALGINTAEGLKKSAGDAFARSAHQRKLKNEAWPEIADDLNAWWDTIF